MTGYNETLSNFKFQTALLQSKSTCDSETGTVERVSI